MCLRRGVPRVALVALIAAGLLLPEPVLAQELEEVFRYPTNEPILDITTTWIDPVVTLGLDPATLEEPPEFDVSDLHDSTVFAAGVDWIPVDDDVLEPLVENHIRVLQVVATLDRDNAEIATQIRDLRPQVQILNDAIDHEHREEARLAYEISVLKTAIAEFAVRAFISEDELETALNLPDTEISETRVVTDEVRDDQFLQIATREAELFERQIRRAGLEEDLRVTRSQLRSLRRDRLNLLRDLRSMQDLSEQTAATYKYTLHQRLEQFVEGTDIPLVALNAYVIAARLQEVENPRCEIGWWMLAGIGRIESFHGHFGDSTLDVNGDTTDKITGPALDGRILEGAEFLVAGTETPGATDRTEVIEIEVSVPTIDDSPVPPLPTEEPATPNDGANTAAESSVAATPSPAPVVKRLALITDSDGGRLDGDPVYDRAVGPMQFIPQTWNQYDVDANLDDESDPNNIYDASLASARYLCTAAGSMATAEGQARAFFAYNHDLEYSENVAAAAARYRGLIEIPDEPLGSAPELGIATPPLVEQEVAPKPTSAFNDPALPDW
ncbi:MAG: hypothetical protein R8J94_00020 [Acidimicrobiia bacterium]|nr:hypothetical protein [Acidimicrobiia bacterium]